MTELFIKGFIIGLSVAAPVGPIGVLCIKRSISTGRNSGLMTGLGAATADSLYACVAGFGLTAISSFLLAYSFFVKLGGGLMLLYLAYRSFSQKPAGTSEISSKSYGRDFFDTLLLTLANPSTIISFVAIFASMGALNEKGSADYSSASQFVAGVFLGSAVWWLFLSSLVSILRERFNLKKIELINKGAAIIIASFGIWAVFSALSS